MGRKLTQSGLQKGLDWAYKKTLRPGIPGIDSVYDLARDYGKGSGTLEEKIDSLIRWQITKAATSGFVSGVGGAFTLPVTIPANISSVLFVQIRMIAAIAKMCGHNVRDDRVQALVYACLVGTKAKEVFKQVGIQAGKKLTTAALKKFPGRIFIEINKRVGFRLLTKFGEKGVVNVWKIIPGVGGAIGGTIDAISTKAVAKAAKETFFHATQKGTR